MPRRNPKYAVELLAADGKADDIYLRAFDRIQEETNPIKHELIFVILKANICTGLFYMFMC